MAKLCSLWYVHFVLTILFVLIVASDRAILHGNDAFSILVLSTKKLYSSFFKKHFISLKICSIENVQKFHWLSHKNMPISETGGYFENS